MPLTPTKVRTNTNIPYTWKSNGCGTQIHIQSTPNQDRSSWTALRVGVTSVVIPLDAEYFLDPISVRIGQQMCGCQITGVGCRICGNALGVLTVHCQAHNPPKHARGKALYSFFPSAVSPPIRDVSLPLPDIASPTPDISIDPPVSLFVTTNMLSPNFRARFEPFIQSRDLDWPQISHIPAAT
ncbi:hypothetical protein B0H10DRAFT_2027924 [Mycena sp. CBHHK59/15]|nr:hypothetical protein B0H10DRAFT_2159220 [Mycena sp. CBHHK59/15]KAJ6618994.1 hypothetical protein B0H10DRAFT_2027924 [Mycena sp. CBHHK59/15]